MLQLLRIKRPSQHALWKTKEPQRFAAALSKTGEVAGLVAFAAAVRSTSGAPARGGAGRRPARLRGRLGSRGRRRCRSGLGSCGLPRRALFLRLLRCGLLGGLLRLLCRLLRCLLGALLLFRRYGLLGFFRLLGLSLLLRLLRHRDHPPVAADQ